MPHCDPDPALVRRDLWEAVDLRIRGRVGIEDGGLIVDRRLRAGIGGDQ